MHGRSNHGTLILGVLADYRHLISPLRISAMSAGRGPPSGPPDRPRRRAGPETSGEATIVGGAPPARPPRGACSDAVEGFFVSLRHRQPPGAPRQRRGRHRNTAAMIMTFEGPRRKSPERARRRHRDNRPDTGRPFPRRRPPRPGPSRPAPAVLGAEPRPPAHYGVFTTEGHISERIDAPAMPELTSTSPFRHDALRRGCESVRRALNSIAWRT